jgi:uncharacterized membrane protein YkvA (DUF1232 family)
MFASEWRYRTAYPWDKVKRHGKVPYRTMAVRVMSWLSAPRLLRTVVSQARLAVRLFREPHVPILTKAVLPLAALYVIWPLDFLPDIIPLLGQLDDLGVAALLLEGFLGLCPAAARTFHAEAIAQGRKYSQMPGTGKIIDAEWRRE